MMMVAIADRALIVTLNAEHLGYENADIFGVL